MAELDHWHPVLKSEELGKKPVRTKLSGRDIAIFRTRAGKLGALANRCPHRGMSLSEGWVEQDDLVCPYHGFRFAPDGSGKSPGTPTQKPCTESFDVVERFGAVWVKRAGAAAVFPSFDVNGYWEVHRARSRVQAPLEIVLDNFTEVEHTPTTHFLLGYPLDKLGEVDVQTTIEERSVRVYNRGPQRKVSKLLEPILEFHPGDEFVDDWTTYFSPVHTIYDQYWLDPKTGQRRPRWLRIAVFFTPIDEGTTDIFVFVYSVAPPWGRWGFDGILFLMLRNFVDGEIGRDRVMIEKLADKSPEIKGNSLGRFDKALLAQRQRITKIYRGTEPS